MILSHNFFWGREIKKKKKFSLVLKFSINSRNYYPSEVLVPSELKIENDDKIKYIKSV